MYLIALNVTETFHFSVELMKKKLSYRDKLVELAYIYDVKEIKDYEKTFLRITEKSIESNFNIYNKKCHHILNHKPKIVDLQEKQ